MLQCSHSVKKKLYETIIFYSLIYEPRCPKILAPIEKYGIHMYGDVHISNLVCLQDTRYKKLYLTSVIVKQLTLAISYFPTNMSIKITASKAAVKERSCYHIC